MAKKGNVPIILGLLLIAAALCLTAYNIWDSTRAGEESHEVLTEIQLPTVVEASSPFVQLAVLGIDNPAPPMATELINGRKYIGVLEIPKYKITLPVMAECDTSNLKIAPCAYYGSYYTNDLVISGHNYSTHFRPLLSIPLNTDVYFTSVDGFRYHYVVDNIVTIEPEDIEGMTTGDWDLTLFTCHTGGRTRCAVRCVLASE